MEAPQPPRPWSVHGEVRARVLPSPPVPAAGHAHPPPG
eukprot:CAMPEP_0198440784 /NCGR_PEP_ID=MMETSP1452-20131203/60206_1 /TAXON_ID=1181717 /ORGANISM="Synchroma pusillum, Strain CCMP3072" /LENGTH=37 /DNA_ID= /DNA_START= /DNA_END= /DNA_ORIENTATION=